MRLANAIVLAVFAEEATERHPANLATQSIRDSWRFDWKTHSVD
jgi:hypothetical protein